MSMHAHSTATNQDWSIELLRGIAACLVMLAHYADYLGLAQSNPLRFSFTGVDLFFLLSGYVFAPYFFGKPLSLSGHFIRRIFRIYPLYLLALAIYAFLHRDLFNLWEILLKHLFFLHTYESYEVAYSLNPAFWSLPPEVEFYLALPLLAALSRGKATAFFLTLAVSAVIHFGLAAASLPYQPAHAITKINLANILLVHLPGLVFEFLLGSLAWWISKRSIKLTSRAFLGLLSLALWSALASMYIANGHDAVQTSQLWRGNIGTFAAIAFFPLLLAWPGSLTAPPRWLVQFGEFAGGLSYGTYLFHNAIPLLLISYRAQLSPTAFTALCALLTLISAHLAHGLLEKPCREFGRELSSRISLPNAKK